MAERDNRDRAAEAAAAGLAREDSRHVRQQRFKPFGEDGQRRLSRAHALVVGIGALGTHQAQTLARAGIGRLTLVDRDVVDLSNLQRQVLFETRDALEGLPKATAAQRAIHRIDPGVEVTAWDTEFDAAFWSRLPEPPDLILDGTDNFASRFVINDLAHAAGVPWIHGAAVGAEGRALVIRPGQTPCLRCLVPDSPAEGPNCDTLGVLAPAVAHVAAFQSTEALKILGGRLEAITRGLFVIDVWAGRFEVLFRETGPRHDCPTCGVGADRSTTVPDTAVEQTSETTSLCGRDAVQVRPASPLSLDLSSLAAQLADRVEDLQELAGRALRFRAGELRLTVFPDGRTLVFGTSEAELARRAHRRFVVTPEVS